jgi:two-component system, OmpR family, phosphate regulon response regulator PhoB
MTVTAEQQGQRAGWTGRLVEWLTGPRSELPPEQGGVLVIEDDQSVGKVITINMELEGIDVRWARDLHSAREELRARTFGTILLDMNLPDGTGLEMLRFIRQDLASTTPIIILSGFKQEDSIVRALEMGANDYMIKPFSPKELMARVHKVRGT